MLFAYKRKPEKKHPEEAYYDKRMTKLHVQAKPYTVRNLCISENKGKDKGACFKLSLSMYDSGEGGSIATIAYPRKGKYKILQI